MEEGGDLIRYESDRTPIPSHGYASSKSPGKLVVPPGSHKTTPTVPSNTRVNSLSLLYYNTRSLATPSKCDSLRVILRVERPHLLLVSETWLSSRLTDTQIIGDLPYVVVRRDRGARGGGVAVLLRDSVPYTRISIPEPQREVVAIDIVSGDSFLRVICAYRPPSYTLAQTTELCDCLYSLVSNSSSPVIVVGDMNVDFLIPPSTPSAHALFDLLSTCSLTQMITSPTRGKRCIDWLATTDTNCISSPTVIPSFPSSDHLGLRCIISSYSSPPASTPPIVRDYSRANYDILDAYLNSIDWENQFDNYQSIDDLYDRFITLVNDSISAVVPNRIPRSQRESYPPHIRSIMRHRDNLFAKLDDTTIAAKYTTVSRSLLREISKWERHSERKRIDSIRNMYRHVARFTKTKPRTLPSLKDPSRPDTPLTSNTDKIELIADEFVNSFTVGDETPFLFTAHPPLPSHFSSATFLPHEVSRTLSRLKPSCSTAADGIPQIVFAKCHHSLSLPLAHIFNISLTLGAVPSIWKTALVTPIPKPGKDNSVASSYRPISILSPACKTLERLISSRLTRHLDWYGILPKWQHGFRSGASVTTNLLVCHNDWTSALSSKRVIDVIYLDFSKAFDTVSHSILITKCAHYGIGGQIIRWLSSFLAHRSFSVRFQGDLSTVRPVTSGVPQGSVLGPILFSIYISDLTHVLAQFPLVTVQGFADDLKLYVTYDEVSRPDAQSQLQSALTAILSWSSINQLSLSLPKCQHLHIGRSKLPIPTYSLSNVKIDTVTQVRDLGIQVTSTLSKTASIDDRVRKAQSALYAVLRCIRIDSSSILVKAYTAYVLPHLEFASPLWNPHLKREIQLLEAVQRRFTRIVYQRCKLALPSEIPPYPDRCAYLGLRSLESRRLESDLYTTHSILHNRLIIHPTDFYVLQPVRERRSRYGLLQERTHTAVREHSFAVRTAKIYDTIPAAALTAKTAKTFKSHIASLAVSLVHTDT